MNSEKTTKLRFTYPNANPIELKPIFETECVTSLNILAHAQILEIDLGSKCGGHGICGADRIRISGTGLSKPNSKEDEHLSQAELKAGIRLACQCFIDSKTAMPITEVEILCGNPDS